MKKQNKLLKAMPFALAFLLVVGIATAALVNYMGNPLVVEARVGSPLLLEGLSGFDDVQSSIDGTLGIPVPSSGVPFVVSSGSIVGGDSIGFTSRIHNFASVPLNANMSISVEGRDGSGALLPAFTTDLDEVVVFGIRILGSSGTWQPDLPIGACAGVGLYWDVTSSKCFFDIKERFVGSGGSNPAVMVVPMTTTLAPLGTYFQAIVVTNVAIAAGNYSVIVQPTI